MDGVQTDLIGPQAYGQQGMIDAWEAMSFPHRPMPDCKSYAQAEDDAMDEYRANKFKAAEDLERLAISRGNALAGPNDRLGD